MAKPSGSLKNGARDPLRVWRTRPEAITIPLAFVLVVGGWELLVALLRVPSYVVPAPSSVVKALVAGLMVDPLSREGYYIHMAYTFSSALAGFVLGSILGITLGTMIAQFRIVDKTIMPYVIGFQTVPKVALAPIFVIWFGYGMPSKLVMTTIITFFPLLVNSIAGFRAVDQEKVDLMRSLCASNWRIFREIRLPSALPFIFAGLNIAIVYSVIGAIVAEFVGSDMGLGLVLLHRNFAMDMAGVFAVLVILSAMGICLYLVLRWVQTKVVFWMPSEDKAAETEL